MDRKVGLSALLKSCRVCEWLYQQSQVEQTVTCTKVCWNYIKGHLELFIWDFMLFFSSCTKLELKCSSTYPTTASVYRYTPSLACLVLQSKHLFSLSYSQGIVVKNRCRARVGLKKSLKRVIKSVQKAQF